MDCKGLHDKNRPPQSHNKDSNKNQIKDSCIETEIAKLKQSPSIN